MPESIIAAPSATPDVAPVSTATTPPVAPSAPAAPLTLADYDKLASDSIRRNEELANTPPAPASSDPAAALESPAAVPAEGTQPLDAAPPEGDAPNEEDPEPSPEEQSQWTDGERRLHGALVKERQNRKDAKAELKALKEQFSALETKLTTPPAVAPTVTATTAPAPSATPALTDCNTFEAVDASAMQAARAESAAFQLNQVLLQHGMDAVLPQLAQHGITVVDGQLVSGGQVLGTADAETVGTFISNVFSGARQTQAQAPIRKQFLRDREASWQQAVKILPEMENIKSEIHQRVGHLLRSNPHLRDRADAPVIAAKLYLGELAWNGKAAPATPAPKPSAPVTPPSAPGAPRTSAAGLPKKTELDGLREKMANGTATLQDADRLASLSLQANAAGR